MTSQIEQGRIAGSRPASPRRKIVRTIVLVVVAAGAIPLLLPLVWMIAVSFKNEFEIFRDPLSLFGSEIRWENYVQIFTQAPFALQYFNSIYIGVLNVAGTLVVSCLAGYGLARLRFPGRALVLPLLVTALLLPIEVIIVPLYTLMTELGWIGTHWPLILEPMFGPGAVIGTFLMRQFFASLPRELEDAGRVDGLSTFGVFMKIALPLARPAIATLGILTFLTSWNAFLEPLVFTGGAENLITLPVALEQFVDIDGTPYYALQMAATTLSVLPVVIVFLFAQRYIIEGIAHSGLKG